MYVSAAGISASKRNESQRDAFRLEAVLLDVFQARSKSVPLSYCCDRLPELHRFRSTERPTKHAWQSSFDSQPTTASNFQPYESYISYSFTDLLRTCGLRALTELFVMKVV